MHIHGKRGEKRNTHIYIDAVCFTALISITSHNITMLSPVIYSFFRLVCHRFSLGSSFSRSVCLFLFTRPTFQFFFLFWRWWLHKISRRTIYWISYWKRNDAIKCNKVVLPTWESLTSAYKRNKYAIFLFVSCHSTYENTFFPIGFSLCAVNIYTQSTTQYRIHHPCQWIVAIAVWLGVYGCQCSCTRAGIYIYTWIFICMWECLFQHSKCMEREKKGSRLSLWNRMASHARLRIYISIALSKLNTKQKPHNFMENLFVLLFSMSLTDFKLFCTALYVSFCLCFVLSFYLSLFFWWIYALQFKLMQCESFSMLAT